MSYQQMVYGADQSGTLSVAFGTAIVQPTTRKKGCKTTLDTVTYTAAGTAHTLTILRDIGKAKLAADALAAQAVVVLDSDPGPVGNLFAVGDLVVIILPNGLPFFAIASAWVLATKTLTLDRNVPTGGVAKGADVYNYGVPGDNDPATGAAHFSLPQGASATTVNNNATGNGLVDSFRSGAPLLIHSNNITATGTINRARWLFTYAPAPPQVTGLLASKRKDVDDSPDE